jgi:trk system potassium uptake protein TrkA
MKCVVIGLGRFGGTVAKQLARAGVEVIAIDKQQRLVDELKGDVTVAVRLDSTTEEGLRSQGVAEADVAIAGIGHDFEATVLTVTLLKKLGVRKIVARVGSELQRRIMELLGADETVFPEEEAARNLGQHILRPNLVDYFKLAGAFTVAEVRVTANFAGKTLKGLDLRKRFGISVIGMKQRAALEGMRRKDTPEGIPSPDEVIESCDELVVIGSDADIKRFLKDMGRA